MSSRSAALIRKSSSGARTGVRPSAPVAARSSRSSARRRREQRAPASSVTSGPHRRSSASAHACPACSVPRPVRAHTVSRCQYGRSPSQSDSGALSRRADHRARSSHAGTSTSARPNRQRVGFAAALVARVEEAAVALLPGQRLAPALASTSAPRSSIGLPLGRAPSTRRPRGRAPLVRRPLRAGARHRRVGVDGPRARSVAAAARAAVLRGRRDGGSGARAPSRRNARPPKNTPRIANSSAVEDIPRPRRPPAPGTESATDRLRRAGSPPARARPPRLATASASAYCSFSIAGSSRSKSLYVACSMSWSRSGSCTPYAPR